MYVVISFLNLLILKWFNYEVSGSMCEVLVYVHLYVFCSSYLNDYSTLQYHISDF